MLFNVLPKFTINDVAYSGLGCSERLRDDSLTNSFGCHTPNTSNLIFGKLGMPMPLAAMDTLGVKPRSMAISACALFWVFLPSVSECLSRVTWTIVSTAGDHIPDVVFLGAFIKMVWITARGIVTCMENMQGGPFTRLQAIRNSMGTNFFIPVMHDTVPVLITMTDPRPASVRIRAVNLGVKPFVQRSIIHRTSLMEVL